MKGSEVRVILTSVGWVFDFLIIIGFEYLEIFKIKESSGPSN
jgi:hypothetical protein